MNEFDYDDYEVTLSRQYADNAVGYLWHLQIIGPNGQVVPSDRTWERKADAERDALAIIQWDIDRNSPPETLTGQDLYERIGERRDVDR